MTTKEKIIKLLKSPFFWMGASIVLVLIMLWSVNKVGKKPCGVGKHYACGGDTCIPTCGEGGTYNCSTKECECLGEAEACGGTKCCPKGHCNDGLCCAKGRQCPSDDGTLKCCSSAQTCINKKCVDTCGTKADGTPIFCSGPDSYCLTVEHPSDSQLDNLEKDFGKEKVNVSDGTAYVCTDKPTCTMSNQEAAPDAINSRYPCTNIFNSKDSDGQLAYCTSDNPDKALTCWSVGIENCASTTGCVVRKPLETDVSVVNNDIENIHNDSDYGSKYLGNWCGETGQWQFLSQESETSGACTAVDCWHMLGKKGVTDVNWDGDKCSTITTCSEGTPIQFKSGPDISYCQRQEHGSDICDDVNYICQDDGSITLPSKKGWVPDLTKSDDNFKCVLGDGPKKYDTEQECLVAYCSNKDENKCCLPGFEFSEGKCYIKPPGQVCVHGGNNPAGKCGVAYTGYTNNEHSQSGCTGRCEVKPRGSTTTPISHCVCNQQSGEWEKFGSGKGTIYLTHSNNSGAFPPYPCSPGKKDDKCPA